MTKVDYNDFVVDWTTSKTLDDFLRTSKLDRAQARYHEKVLRSAGVNLKELKMASNGLDNLRVAQLNSLINKHTRSQ